VGEFASAYNWQRGVLQFSDAPRGVRYEVQIGATQAAPAASVATP